MQLKDRTAVVTGAASGIGRATAETLAAAGAFVLLGDIDEQKGAEAAEALRASGCGAEFIRLDVTDLESIAAFKQRAYALRGHVDIVANVAGWGKIQPFMENTPEFWRKVIDLNLLGPIAVSHAFLDKMIERGAGKIVVVSSDAGRVGSMGETVYSGAKGGAIAFCKSLAREVARYNINVNCVCPGSDRYAAAASRAGKAPGSLRQGDADAPSGQAFGDRRCRAVLRQRPGELRHRAGAQRERRPDPGGLTTRLSS